MFDSPASATVLVSAAAAVGVIVLAAIGSLLLGPGARRQRTYARAQLLLRQGNWQEALVLVRGLRHPTLSPQWQGKLNNLEGECHLAAAEAALNEQRYEQSLSQFTEAGRLLVLKTEELHIRVLETMLADIRKQFADDTVEATRAVLDVAQRASNLMPCAEASFWLGLGHLRIGDEEQAAAALLTAHQIGNQRFVDPPLYLGALRLRQGQPQEALRFLSEANRTDSSCPIVPWQLGLAIVAAGGDGRLALQALARALGPRGLHVWARPSTNGAANSAQRLWAEGMPENRSFVRRLAQQHRFHCPLLGDDLKAMIRQGQMAMAQAHQRLGNFQAAADIYAQILQENPPTFGLLRGLGLALARMDRYDQAFKHLRTALEMEPKDQLTAGYLALCGAMGKPTQDDDKPRNVAWAVRLLARFRVKNDPEWARIVAWVLREARISGVAVPAEELAPLCESLVSVHSADAAAAAAYHQMAEIVPDALRPIHAWLYGRAVQQHGVTGKHDLDLFALAWRDQEALGAFYTERDWDLAEMEYCYLERSSQKLPGRFPEALGPDYPPRGSEFLRQRSRKLEEAGKLKDALAVMTVLARLAPEDAAAPDRLAYLCHRQGDLENSAHHLAECCRLSPGDHRVLLRLAVVEQQRGRAEARRAIVRRALAMTTGADQAATAFLGARLALASAVDGNTDDQAEAAALLETSLLANPDHVEAAWQLAALRCLQNDRSALVELTGRLDRPDVTEPRFQHLAAVCHLVAGRFSDAMAAAEKTAADANLAADSRYLAGFAAFQQGDYAAAMTHLQAASGAAAPSAEGARSLLGRVHFLQGRYPEAVACWSALSAENRAAWKLDEPLQAVAFLDALKAFQEQRFAEAAEKMREAGRLGCRDPRLGPLLARSLFEAGRQLLLAPPKSATDPPPVDEEDIPLALPIDAEADAAAGLLDQALKAGCSDPDASYLQGIAHRRAERFGDARAAFRKMPKPESRVFLQLGLLSLLEGQLAQAEQEFARARELDASSYAACYNLLLTRLSLGQLDAAEPLIEPARDIAPAESEKHILRLGGALLRTCLSARGGDRAVDPLLLEMNADDEEQLLRLIRGLGNGETSLVLLKTLTAARRESKAVQETFFEAILLQGQGLIHRGAWGEAERLLGPWASRRTLSREYLRSLRNLLGCSATLGQDFAGGLRHFQAAVALVDPPGDPRLNLNIALTLEFQGDPGAAEEHWARGFDLFEYLLNEPGSDRGGLMRRMLFHGLVRLVNRFCDREKWQAALPFAERAHRIQPDNIELLERLFQLYQHLYQADAARWALTQLREHQPDDPRYELYEIDLLPVGGIKEADHVLGEIEAVLRRHPGNVRVEERAQSMVVGVLTVLTRRGDQLSEDLDRVLRRIKKQPKHHVDWHWVEDTAADLLHDFERLRKVTLRCQSLTHHPDARRTADELLGRIRRKTEICESLEG